MLDATLQRLLNGLVDAHKRRAIGNDNRATPRVSRAATCDADAGMASDNHMRRAVPQVQCDPQWIHCRNASRRNVGRFARYYTATATPVAAWTWASSACSGTSNAPAERDA